MAATPRILLVLLIAALGVALTTAAAQSSGPDRTTARIAKKCKKKHQGKKKARKGCKKKTPTTVTPPAVSPPSCADDSLEPNDSVDQATPYDPGPSWSSKVEGVVCSPNSDFFAFMSSGYPIVVDITTLTPFSPYAKLYDSEGTLLTWPPGWPVSGTYANGVRYFASVLPSSVEPTKYYVEVWGAFGSSGGYTFSVNPVGAPF